MAEKQSSGWNPMTIVLFAVIAAVVVLAFMTTRQTPTPSTNAQIEAPENYDDTTYATIEEAARHCPGDVTAIAGPVSSPPRYGCAEDTSRRFGGS